jgi:hypothetical protein
VTDSRIEVHRARARETGTARPRARLAALLIVAGVALFVTGLVPGCQGQRALSTPSHPVYSPGDVGTPTRVTLQGREGFSMPLTLTLKLCSPAPAGELGTTP